jgi:hypothetical protein
MKQFATLTVLLVSLIAVNAADKPKFQVRCPVCLSNQVLVAKSVVGNGGYSTNIAGIEGTMSQWTASLKCGNLACKAKFTAPIKPDKFVPIFPATPTKK